MATVSESLLLSGSLFQLTFLSYFDYAATAIITFR